MSLFLHFPRVRCLIRKTTGGRRFCWTNHGFAVPEGLRIRYFIPRTSDSDVYVKVQTKKDQQGLRGDFRVVYRFTSEKFLEGVTYSSLGFLGIIIYFLLNLKKLEQSKTEEYHKIEKEELTLEYDSAYTESVKRNNEYGIWNLNFVNSVYEANPKAKLFVALSMIILFFFIRSRVVLTIYRSYNDFITVFYQPLGFKKKLIQHKASDCCYYPKKYLNYNLLGKNVIIFPEFFVSKEEAELYAGGNKSRQAKNFK